MEVESATFDTDPFFLIHGSPMMCGACPWANGVSNQGQYPSTCSGQDTLWCGLKVADTHSLRRVAPREVPTIEAGSNSHAQRALSWYHGLSPSREPFECPVHLIVTESYQLWRSRIAVEFEGQGGLVQLTGPVMTLSMFLF